MFRKFILPLFLTAVGLFFKSCEFPESMKSGYRIEDGKVVLYSGFPASRTVIGQADAQTFKAINYNYGKDSKQVFYYSGVIEGADAASFEYLGGSYSKDKNRGYTVDKPISDDGAHFAIVPNPEDTESNRTAAGIVYARDSRQVYHSLMVLEGADPASFRYVPMFNGYDLACDKRAVYWQSKPIEGADGQTFVRVTAVHFKDKNKVWGLFLGRDVHWVQLPEADAVSFTKLDQFYAKDKNKVYYETKVVEGADPVTFKVPENQTANE